MKNLTFILLSASVILSSCFGTQKLKGSYGNKPYVISSDKPAEEVWSNIIDFFSQNGISIQTIDKSSGLIVSNDNDFKDAVTFEKKDGTLEHPKDWVVVERKEIWGNAVMPTVTGRWNIRIKSSPDKKTSINVNLTSIKASYYSTGNKYAPAMNVPLEARSTGVFEQLIADKVK